MKATKSPILLSPCLNPYPDVGHERDHVKEKHLELLFRPRSRDSLKARSAIIQYVRQFLLDRSFIEVETPILAAAAGGASARPFHTTATEFPERELSLRISPELWLKRLIIGGFDKIFEIGPAFRNEGEYVRGPILVAELMPIGLDATHNPEFTTCEFYQAYADLDKLIETTEDMIVGLTKHFFSLNLSFLPTPEIDEVLPFARLDFIPEIENAVGDRLPDLEKPEALQTLVDIFRKHSLPLTKNPTLDQLLDGLASRFLEPQCLKPTFIINQPKCLSPLSKSFLHPVTNQVVAARAELFIQGKEIANMYEEENSPFQQRLKFEQQHGAREDDAAHDIDEDYVEALKWGLPPTAGWGAGLDRLVMLFTGATRIRDVLSFGDLRAVSRVRSGVQGPKNEKRS